MLNAAAQMYRSIWCNLMAAHQNDMKLWITLWRQVYISICCNLAGAEHPTFAELPVPFAFYPKVNILNLMHMFREMTFQL